MVEIRNQREYPVGIDCSGHRSDVASLHSRQPDAPATGALALGKMFQPVQGRLAFPAQTLADATDLTALETIFRDEIEGSRVVGIDRVSPSAYKERLSENLAIQQRQLRTGDYHFVPYRQLLRSKGRESAPRVISLPAVRDRLALGALRTVLHNRYPSRVQRRLPNQMVRELVHWCRGQSSLSGLYVVRTDVRGFYDNVSWPFLDSQISGLDEPSRVAIRRALENPTVGHNYRRVDRRQLRETRRMAMKGIPQGLSISNVLAEIAMPDVDALLATLPYAIRYVDDVLAVVPESDVDSFLAMLETAMKPAGLSLHPKKTARGPLDEAFTFLGYEFAFPSKVTVRAASVHRFVSGIASRTREHARRVASFGPRKRAAEERFLKLDINERVTGAISGSRQYGWLFYFLEMDDLGLLYRLDKTIVGLLDRVGYRGQPPKRLVRAYHEARHDRTGGYILNYDSLRSVDDRIQHLVKYGAMTRAQANSASEADVHRVFDRVRARRLTRLDKDVGVIS